MLLIFTFSTESEKDIFEALYNNCKGLMLQKAYGILHDRMLAEDAVSEAFIRVYKNLYKIDDPSSNRSIAFVMMIVKNTALTILSKEKAQAVEELDETKQDSFMLEDFVLSKISNERIYELLNKLKEELRSVFLMKYAYDLPHKKIGELLNISENNVTVRIHRAKKQIIEILKEEEFAVEG